MIWPRLHSQEAGKVGLNPGSLVCSHLRKEEGIVAQPFHRICYILGITLTTPCLLLLLLVLGLFLFLPPYTGNKIFMCKIPCELILKNSKKIILYFVRSKHQRLNMHSMDLLSSRARFSLWFTRSTAVFCKIMWEEGKTSVKVIRSFKNWSRLFL